MLLQKNVALQALYIHKGNCLLFLEIKSWVQPRWYGCVPPLDIPHCIPQMNVSSFWQHHFTGTTNVYSAQFLHPKCSGAIWTQACRGRDPRADLAPSEQVLLCRSWHQLLSPIQSHLSALSSWEVPAPRLPPVCNIPGSLQSWNFLLGNPVGGCQTLIMYPHHGSQGTNPHWNFQGNNNIKYQCISNY